MENLSYTPSTYVEDFGLNDLSIFNVKSKKYLSYILQTKLETLKNIYKNPHNFYRFEDKEITKNGKTKTRKIEDPNWTLKPIHKLIHQLISKIPTPDYLFSKKKSSCVLNAKAHSSISGFTLNIDIESFFQSTQKHKVQSFFGYFLQYPRDVAEFMAEICTINNHIPTGSPLSLMLAFWANKPMFDELNALSKSRNITMTIYVDDISFTGMAVNERFKYKVLEIIGKYNHKVNKDKIRFFGKNFKFINGIAIINKQLVPNNKISRDVRELKTNIDSKNINNLKGKTNYINYIKSVNAT